MAKNGYTTLNLPTSLVEELRVWRLAFSAAYGRTISYGEMIRSMLDGLEDSEPGVVEDLDRIIRNHPELQSKIANFQDRPGTEAKKSKMKLSS